MLKTKNRLITSLIVFMMMFSIVAMPTSAQAADPTLKIEVPAASYEVGDTFIAQVKISDVTFAASQITVYFNPSVLQVVDNTGTLTTDPEQGLKINESNMSGAFAKWDFKVLPVIDNSSGLVDVELSVKAGKPAYEVTAEEDYVGIRFKAIGNGDPNIHFATPASPAHTPTNSTGYIFAVDGVGTAMTLVEPTVTVGAATDTEITVFDTIADVAAGTAGSATYADAAAVISALPTTATANSSAVTVPVTGWVDTDGYNPAVAGNYTFTATLGAIPAGYKNTGGLTATVKVVVAAAIPVTGVTLDAAILNLTAGGGIGTLVATVNPTEATNKNVTWSSSDTAVATVANGVVTPVAAGTATITVKTDDGSFTATCEVTVTAVDTTAPVITATDETVAIADLAAWTETVSATDDVDGDISANVVATYFESNGTTSLTDLAAAKTYIGDASVNTKFVIKYNVSDAASNAATEVEVTITVTPAAAVPVTGVTLDAAILNLTAGGGIGTLVATVNPTEATNKNVTWSSSDTAVATVANGVVTPVAAGTATITVKTDDGSFTATCEVTVTAVDTTAPVITATDETVAIADLAAWTETVSATDDVDGDISANVVATYFESNGTTSLTDLAAAKTYIGDASVNTKFVIKYNVSDAASNAATEVEVTITVTPAAAVPVTGVTLDAAILNLTAGGGIGTLVATVNPTEATNKNVTWSSSDTAVATVANGVVTPVAAGTATITVKTDDGSFTATCEVTVTAVDTTAPVITATDETVAIADLAAWTETVSATDDVDGDISANVVATYFESNGTTSLTDLAAAKTYIGDASVNTKFVIKYNVSDAASNAATEVEVTITVTPAAAVPVTGVTLDAAILNLTAGGGIGTLVATVNPTEATNKNVTWSSSDTAVATVANGVVTPVAAGTATITVKTDDGSFTATCEVTVTAVDTTAPVITATDETVAIADLAAWTETVSATDDVDGDISANVVATYFESNGTTSLTDLAAAKTYIGDASVNTKFVIKYNVSDAASNAATEVEVTITVTPAAAVPVTGVTLDAAILNLTAGGGIGTLVATVNPTEATNKNVTWSSSDTAVATVANGVVTPVAAGTATITVKTDDGSFTATSTVNVLAALSNDASLSSLTLSGVTLSPTFAAGTKTYTATVANSVASTTVTATANDINANITAADLGTKTLAVGANTITVNVTAKDGITKTAYTVVITRKSASTGGGSSGGGTPAFAGTSVKASEGGTVTGSGASIVIPANATSSDIKVKVETISNIANLPMAAKDKFVSRVLEITKDKSANFKKAVTITISYDKSKVDTDEYDLAIYWLNTSTNKWIKLDNIKVDIETGKVSGEVDHFTKFAVIATEKAVTPEPPVEPVTPPVTPEPVVLKDITGHWAQANITKLVDSGAIAGYPDKTFKPNASITRAEFATVLVKAFKLESKNGKVFADTSNHWAKTSIATAQVYGIISGYSDVKFGPDEQITREQMAVMIAKAKNLTKTQGAKTFTDNGQISSWAKEALASTTAAGLMSGYPDGSFQPQGHATRAEAVTVIVKAIQ